MGLGFTCESFPLLCACWEVRFYLAEGLRWAAGLVTFLVLISPLLFSLAGIEKIVASWLLKVLFKEGCSVLPLVETYSHPRTCYYCFRAVTLKLSRSAEYPTVINSEIQMMIKIQITNHMVKKKWLKKKTKVVSLCLWMEFGFVFPVMFDTSALHCVKQQYPHWWTLCAVIIAFLLFFPSSLSLILCCLASIFGRAAWNECSLFGSLELGLALSVFQLQMLVPKTVLGCVWMCLGIN